MPNSGHNEGFRVLEEFACKAIPSSGLASPGSAGPGENTGMGMLTELVVRASDPSAPPERLAQLRAMSSLELLALVHSSGSRLSREELLAIHDIAAERCTKADDPLSQPAIELSRATMLVAINRTS
jgi:hypothetical protein